MAELSAKQKAFVNRMTEGDEYERQGVELLIKHPHFEAFFEALAEARLFDPAHNPAPREGDKPGLYWIPYWHILDYLKAVAKRSNERSDIALAQKVIAVLRDVTNASAGKEPLADNHYTAHAFVQILGLLPTAAVSMNDIDLIPAWLGGRFERTLIGPAFAENTMSHYIGGDNPADWPKACQILRHCTVLRWTDKKGLGGDRKEPVTVVEDYWLKKIINGSTEALGAKIGSEAASIFLGRLRETYSDDLYKRASWHARPAIEEHEQNHSWDGPENRFVEGLRDVLLAWVDVDPIKAKAFVDALMTDDDQIVRRIALHIVNERFVHWHKSVSELIKPRLFDMSLLHETYRFLQAHFAEFSPQDQIAVVGLIRLVPESDGTEKEERYRRRTQRQWLSAIGGRGSADADKWYAELEADGTLGRLQPHPDFHSYMETRWGFGDSPYTDLQLVEFAESNVLIERLNEFVPRASWDGPTARSLADTLETAVAGAPTRFVALLPEVIRMKRTYQYATINGFKKLWDGPDEIRARIDWEQAWPALFTLFECLIGDDGFWEEKVVTDADLTPNRNWIAPIIADFIRAGVRSDEKAFNPDLLPRSWVLIQILLQRMEPEAEASESDAMTRAINSAKGKAIEALFDHALRVCRVSDSVIGNHDAAWAHMKSVFDRELESCKNANFDFSTLAGSYIAQLRYLDLRWYEENFRKVFSIDYPANCLSALSGLAFAVATSYVYASLKDAGVLAWALKREMKDESAREHLLQRLALALIWGQEDIDGPHLSYLFEASREDDLEMMARFLWSLSNQKVNGEQAERIIQFWNRCVEWSEGRDNPSETLLSMLSLLSYYITAIGDRERKLLQVAASYVAVGYHADEFIENLERLAPEYPEPVAEIFGAVLRNYKPVFDFEDRIKKLLTHLSKHDQTRPHALRFTNQLSHFPAIMDIYKELVG